MLAEFACPSCGGQVSAAVEEKGGSVECTQCGQPVKVEFQQAAYRVASKKLRRGLLSALLGILALALGLFGLLWLSDHPSTLPALPPGLVESLLIAGLAIIAAILAIAWLFFPLLVCRDLAEIKRLLRDIRAASQQP